MVATSGARLISEEAVETLKKELFPLACILTPNIPGPKPHRDGSEEHRGYD